MTGNATSLAANVAVAEPTMAGRVIAAWPSSALIGAAELLMRQVRRAADGSMSPPTNRSWRVTPAAAGRAIRPGVAGRRGGTEGNTLNRRGKQAGINERTRFTGPESRVRRYASEELLI